MASRAARYLPQLVVTPGVILVLTGVYGFIAFTLAISFTDSGILPSWNFVGGLNYRTLFSLSGWTTSVNNLVAFSIVFIGASVVLGLALAILIDRRIRAEGAFRSIYLYPMALSFIVTGTAWKWFLDPGIGLESVAHGLGWTAFSFDWIKNRDFAIYTIAIAAVWQTAGFAMALFLAGLRGIDEEILKAARVDGASVVQQYVRIILPQLGYTFVSVLVILVYNAIRTYDLVIVMTSGGPGRATWLPSVFMYQYTFTRNQMGVGAASAIVMLAAIAVIVIPYIAWELRQGKRT
jgi:glucose/mannose transport system permease protein